MITKILNNKKIFAFCAFLLFVKCYSNRMVPFEVLNSEMEVSQEENGQITFRAFYKQNGFQSIVDAVVRDSVIDQERVHYLILLYGPYEKDNSNLIIKKIPYGIKVTLSGDFNFEEDRFYYCDKVGCHMLQKGTINTWEKKVGKYLEKNNIVH